MVIMLRVFFHHMMLVMRAAKTVSTVSNQTWSHTGCLRVEHSTCSRTQVRF